VKRKRKNRQRRPRTAREGVGRERTGDDGGQVEVERLREHAEDVHDGERHVGADHARRVGRVGEVSGELRHDPVQQRVADPVGLGRELGLVQLLLPLCLGLVDRLLLLFFLLLILVFFLVVFVLLLLLVVFVLLFLLLFLAFLFLGLDVHGVGGVGRGVLENSGKGEAAEHGAHDLDHERRDMGLAPDGLEQTQQQALVSAPGEPGRQRGDRLRGLVHDVTVHVLRLVLVELLYGRVCVVCVVSNQSVCGMRGMLRVAATYVGLDGLDELGEDERNEHAVDGGGLQLRQDLRRLQHAEGVQHARALDVEHVVEEVDVLVALARAPALLLARDRVDVLDGPGRLRLLLGLVLGLERLAQPFAHLGLLIDFGVEHHQVGVGRLGRYHGVVAQQLERVLAQVLVHARRILVQQRQDRLVTWQVKTPHTPHTLAHRTAHAHRTQDDTYRCAGAARCPSG